MSERKLRRQRQRQILMEGHLLVWQFEMIRDTLPRAAPLIARFRLDLRIDGPKLIVPFSPNRLEIVMDDVMIVRALHVLAVVVWIGGVAMTTTVLLPAVRQGELGTNWLQAFHVIERRFAWQARIAVIAVGVTGLYMSARLELWDRFTSVRYWWMHAMVCLWLLFTFVLFVAEPFVAARHFDKWATQAPRDAFKWLYRGHLALLAFSLITIFGAVAGSHGWSLL
jgi:uncharacterized membrane protein